MDNKPLIPSSAETETQTRDDADLPEQLALPTAPLFGKSSSSATHGRFAVRDAFIGPEGIYALPRWLIYLALAWVVFQGEVRLEAALYSQLNFLW
jgi:hypothetical protein